MSVIQKLMSGNLDILGDIHGEYDALMTLVEHLGYDENGLHPEGRKMVFVGDLCDRGPETIKVIEQVKKWVNNGNAQAIIGNHELNILQGTPKDGTGWFFEEQVKKDKEYEPFHRASAQEKKEAFEFLKNLPLVLEREDLRIVHAAWDDSRIEILRQVPLGSIGQYYQQKEKEVDESMMSSGLLKAYKDEQAQWGAEQAKPDGKLPFLEVTSRYNVEHQMTNPVRVLTSGVEKRADKPFFASGKWRFVQRCAWWEDYKSDVPVVVGHYWRKMSPEFSNIQDENLFKDIANNAWFGANQNVFCIDYSVGGRFKERKKGQPLGQTTQLVALRWPENELVLEQGQVIPTVGFKVKSQKKKKL